MGFPHGILENAPPLLETIATLIEKEQVGAVVIGESLDFSGADNPIAAAARALGASLRARTGVPVLLRRRAAYERRGAPAVRGKREDAQAPTGPRSSTPPPQRSSLPAIFHNTWISLRFL
jgi:hypothetical protein